MLSLLLEGARAFEGRLLLEGALQKMLLQFRVHCVRELQHPLFADAEENQGISFSFGTYSLLCQTPACYHPVCSAVVRRYILQQVRDRHLLVSEGGEQRTAGAPQRICGGACPPANRRVSLSCRLNSIWHMSAPWRKTCAV